MFARTHARLIAARRPCRDETEAFDAHVLACVLANALDEAAAGEGDLAAATGLDRATLAAVLERWFPGIAAEDLLRFAGPAPVLTDEEEMLRDLLLAHAHRRGEGTLHPGETASSAAGADHVGFEAAPDLPTLLASVVARRAMKPDHLWQDLGLCDRSELNRLLARHFPTLAAGNTANMKWKKYFYRKLCEAEGFVLCTAPSCSVCTDFAVCFGAEDGESRMARTRLAVDLSTVKRPLQVGLG